MANEHQLLIVRKGCDNMKIRRAAADDIASVEKIYDAVHTAEEKGEQQTGWIRGVYPVRATAEEALRRNDLFVLEDDGALYGSGIINNIQPEVYSRGSWKHAADGNQVCVLHTLAIHPSRRGRGYGREFLAFFENYAAEHGCPELRIDTNERNKAARQMYTKRRYTEIGIVPTQFNGIPDVRLVLLEKYLGKVPEK